MRTQSFPPEWVSARGQGIEGPHPGTPSTSLCPALPVCASFSRKPGWSSRAQLPFESPKSGVSHLSSPQLPPCSGLPPTRGPLLRGHLTCASWRPCLGATTEELCGWLHSVPAPGERRLQEREPILRSLGAHHEPRPPEPEGEGLHHLSAPRCPSMRSIGPCQLPAKLLSGTPPEGSTHLLFPRGSPH